MAKLWAVKEGPHPGNQSGYPLEVTVREIMEVFGSVSAKWLGTKPPSITPGQETKLSSWPRYTVAEIEQTDALNTRFPRPGFYEMEGLSPARAEDDTKAHRAKTIDDGSPGGS